MATGIRLQSSEAASGLTASRIVPSMGASDDLDGDERLDWLGGRLRAEGRVRIRSAAVELGVSEMTLRRDLQKLEGLGVARRVRGGAIAIGPTVFAERHRVRARAKARIATKLLQLVPSSGAIGLDASSTMFRLATAMEDARDLTVVTNGRETFQALMSKPGISVELTGGQLDVRTGSLVGPVACRAADDLFLSTVFLSAAGVDAGRGTSEATLEEAVVKRALAAAAAEIVVGIDSTKLGAPAAAKALDWSQVAVLVTELDPGDARLAHYRDVVQVR